MNQYFFTPLANNEKEYLFFLSWVLCEKRFLLSATVRMKGETDAGRRLNTLNMRALKG